MASEVIIGGLILFVQVIAAFIVLLFLISPSRKAIDWFRNGRMRSGTITIKEFARPVLYFVGLLFVAGTLVGAVTGSWFNPVLVVWWIVVLATGMAQIDVAVIWAFFFAVVLVWTISVTLFKKRPKRIASATESG
jgi:hypothetical protein